MTFVLIGAILAGWLFVGALLATVIGRVVMLRRDDDGFDHATVVFLDALWDLEPTQQAGSVGVGSD